MTRREFLQVSAASAAIGWTETGCATQSVSGGGASASAGTRGIRLRFLGSGSASWDEAWAKENPFMRRQSSVLLENSVLIDFTACAFDLLPEGCHPEALFQTHSHGDHYDPASAVRVGVRRLYVHETWASAARAHIAAAAEKLALPAPEVIPLAFGVPVTEGDLTVMAVPANHSTSRVTDGVLERTCLYLVEKGPARLLYATDTGGIPGDAARMIGIDRHVNDKSYPARYAGNPFVRPPQAITALVMEATNGDLDDDFRMFVHSGVPLVARTAAVLKKTGRLVLPEGQSVYLTHLGIKYRGWPAEKIDAELPEGLKAASDGLELVLG